MHGLYDQSTTDRDLQSDQIAMSNASKACNAEDL